MRPKVTLSELREACSVPLGDHTEKVRRKGERQWHTIPEMVGFLPFRRRDFAKPRMSFSTGLYDRGEFAPKPVFCGDWHIDFRQTFSLFETRLQRNVDAWETYGGHASLQNMPSGYGVSAPEALIFSSSQDKADEILMLINAAMILFNGYAPFERDDVSVKQDTLSSLPCEFTASSSIVGRTRVAVNGVVTSCQFVANIWKQEVIRLALARLYHSTYIAYFHPLDASPSFGDFAEFDTSCFPLMAYALAITAAYSAIEELDCQPKTRKRGDFIFKQGQWNQIVVAELKKRVADRGIDPEEEIIWISRGQKRLIDSKIAPAKGKAAGWNRARINDRVVPLYEAILLCSRIRNRAAAHNTKRETKALTPVDLVNVQSVCRHLLMAYGGMPLASRVNDRGSVLEFQ